MANIPSKRLINFEEIIRCDLSNYQGILETMPSAYNYNFLSNFVLLVENIIKSIPDNSLVICPGDSPSKIVVIAKYMFNKYLCDHNIMLMSFPLSGIKDGNSKVEKTLELLSQYFDKLKISTFRVNRTVHLLDSVSKGETSRFLSEYLNLDSVIDIRVHWEKIYGICNESYYLTINGAESHNCRTLPSFKLGLDEEPIKNISYYRSNIFLSMVILNYYGNLTLPDQTLNFWCTRSNTMQTKLRYGVLTYSTYYSISLSKYVNRFCVFFKLKNITSEVIVIRLGKRKLIEKIGSVGYIVSVGYVPMLNCRNFYDKNIIATLTDCSKRKGLFKPDGSIDNEKIGWFITKVQLEPLL